MRIDRALVDLARLEALNALHLLPESGSDIGKHGFSLSDYLSVELTDSTDGLPACIAGDVTVFGCIIGHSELVGGTTVRALKVDFTDGNFVGHNSPPANTGDSAARS